MPTFRSQICREFWTVDSQLAPRGLRQALFLLVLTITTTLLVYLTFLLRENHTKINLVEFSSGASTHAVRLEVKVCVKKWEIFWPFSPTLSYTFWSRNCCIFQKKKVNNKFYLRKNRVSSLFCSFCSKFWNERNVFLMKWDSTLSLSVRNMDLSLQSLCSLRFFLFGKERRVLSAKEYGNADQ